VQWHRRLRTHSPKDYYGGKTRLCQPENSRSAEDGSGVRPYVQAILRATFRLSRLGRTSTVLNPIPGSSAQGAWIPPEPLRGDPSTNHRRATASRPGGRRAPAE
jgi:hypothetical protein